MSLVPLSESLLLFNVYIASSSSTLDHSEASLYIWSIIDSEK